MVVYGFRADYVVIGGTRQAGDEDVSSRQEDRQDIIQKCSRLAPMVKVVPLIFSVNYKPGVT